MRGGELTPRQQEVREHLLSIGQQRPVADRQLGQRLRRLLHEELRSLAAILPAGRHVRVSKHRLAAARACEGYLDAIGRDFAWSTANVRGRVVHRALEFLVLEPGRWHPLTATKAAIESLAAGGDEHGPGPFVAGLADVERHSLVREVNDVCVKFLADWPPIPASWYPRIESEARVAFGPVSLRAVFDLVLGVPLGSQRRTLIVDFKTGAEHPAHRHDLQFYALLETLRSGTPPFRVASYYLDAGRWQAEEVDDDLLDAAAGQLLDAVTTMVRVEAKGVGEVRPGWACRFCPVSEDCEEGGRWLDDHQGW